MREKAAGKQKIRKWYKEAKATKGNEKKQQNEKGNRREQKATEIVEKGNKRQ